MSDPQFLVCPSCGRAEPATGAAACPACGSERTYLHPDPVLPDATTEAYVKLDAEDAAREGETTSEGDAEATEGSGQSGDRG